MGSGQGTILASIGTPMLLSALTGKGMKGGAAPRMGKYRPSTGGSAARMGRYRPPPFMDNWPSTARGGTRKKKKGKVLLLGKNSPFKNVPIIGATL